MRIIYCLLPRCVLLLTAASVTYSADPNPSGSGDYNVQHNDGSYEFGYNADDHFHYADGTKDNFVRGQFGSRNPGTGAIDTTSYTSGPRGFRPRGKNIHRKYDLNQIGPRAIGSKDDPYFDPNEDPSYSFGFRTRTYTRQEAANRVGDVTGRYSYLDDVGERHNVEYIAGKNTGFHVRTPYPDSNPRAVGSLYYQGPGQPPRGRTSIQRGLDGSYRFVSAGPDQRRTEMSDASGHVRGSYTYLDDKGIQHSVHYIAGPETGYRVLKNVKGPHFPNWYPFSPGRPGFPTPDFPDDAGEKNIEDIFGENLNTAASGHVKPPKKFGASGVGSDTKPGETKPTFGDTNPSFGDTKPLFGDTKPSFGDTSLSDEDNFADDLFKPSVSPALKPSKDFEAPGTGTKLPKPQKPSPTSSTFFDEDLSKPFDLPEDKFNVFGPTKVPGGSKGTSGGSVHLGASFDGKGTILTNIGDRYISFPPGVAVRAHIQSIDILPFGSRLPSPSEQLKSESLIAKDEKKST